MGKKRIAKIIYILAMCLAISSVSFSSSGINVYEDYYYGLFSFINTFYRTELGIDGIMGAAFNGAMENMPEYSCYEIADRDMEAMPEGTGALLEKVRDGFIVVSVNPSSPAYDAGIKPGDIIHRVDKQNAAVMGIYAFNTYMQTNGSAVLEIIDRDTGYIRTERIGAASGYMQTVDFLFLDDAGYMRIKGFDSDTAGRVKGALDSMKELGQANLIIDLRDMVSMNIDDASKVADLLVPGGTIARTQAGTYNASPKEIGFKVSLLINQYTKGAGEVIAAAVNGTSYGAATAGEAVYIRKYPVFTDSAFLKYSREAGSSDVRAMLNYIKYRKVEVPEGYVAGYLNIVESGVYNSSGRLISEKAKVEPDVFITDTSIGYMDYKPDGDIIEVRRDYAEGSVNYDVYSAKRILALLGIYTGPMDVVFGPEMTTAVNYYKKSRGYPADGILDMGIQAVLNTYAMKAAVMNDECVKAALLGF
ncbi:MAG: S41 family peptidase [Clostridia bacterium]